MEYNRCGFLCAKDILIIVAMRPKERNLRPVKSDSCVLFPPPRPISRHLPTPTTSHPSHNQRPLLSRKVVRTSQPALPYLRSSVRITSKSPPESVKRPEENLELCISSKAGGTHSRTKPQNQDAGVGCKLEAKQTSHLLLVCDGHGDWGHSISARIVDSLPKLLTEALNKCEGQRFDGTIGALRDACLGANEDLRQSGSTCRASGSTCVAVLIQRNRLLCANVGDSRAVLGRITPAGCVPYSLSHDHKPDDPMERMRIEQAGGRVASESKQPYGSLRVWFPDEEGPGLAMSRAFGDFDAQEIGIVGTPDITLTPRTDQDLCVVVASDGVWQYVSEAEAVELVEQASLQGERAQAAERLVELATQRWFAHESRRDDITALVAFLDQ